MTLGSQSSGSTARTITWTYNAPYDVQCAGVSATSSMQGYIQNITWSGNTITLTMQISAYYTVTPTITYAHF